MKQEPPDFEISFFEGLVEKDPNFVDALIPLADEYTRRGLYEKGLEIDIRLAGLCQDDPIVYYNLACSYALIGDLDKSIASLQKSIRLGYSDFAHLKKDADLKILQDDPRFVKLLTKAVRPKKK